MNLSEPVLSKNTLFLIKDWYGFQLALRTCLFLLLFLATVCSVPGDPAAQVSDSGEKAVVLAAFGTSHESALPGILNIRDQVKSSLPGNVPVKLAFTSSIIRKIWQERRLDQDYKKSHPEIPDYVLHVKGTLASIADFQDQGYDYIVVQPTHFTSGEEFADLSSYVAGFNSIKTVKKRNMPFRKVLLGRPALGTAGIEHEYRHDIEQAAKALAPDAELAEKEGRALIYMAHGNEHFPLGGAYLEFEQVMRKRYPEVETYVTTVEGFPGKDYLLERLAAADVHDVLIKPFMTVAGDHAKNDMAGEDSDSLKNVLEVQGYDAAVILEGLGENDGFASIFAEHLQDAVQDEGLQF